MKLHLVGGFLGSGKTTAIIAAAKLLISQGKRVGVVTNDQGKYLVDTSFFQSNQIPTVEVTKGCFCSYYDKFEDKINELQVKDRPDVIFAESVGSSGDIVATVIKPLLTLSESPLSSISLSVFVDSMLLLAYLDGEDLPFSENILYIFKKQIEQAQILVLNKIDLLTGDEVDRLKRLANREYPEKTLHLQNSNSESDIEAWYALITEKNVDPTIESIEIDYSKYRQGETELAWLDQKVTIKAKQGNVYDGIIDLIAGIQQEIARHNAAIGHLKFMISTSSENIKISIPTIEQKGWRDELKRNQDTEARVLINARIQIHPDLLKKLVTSAVDDLAHNPEYEVVSQKMQVFKPDAPHPTYRISG